MALIRAYLAMSLDGFIAGPGDDLAWLVEPRRSGVALESSPWADAPMDAVTFDAFMADVGCILMGRRTYDVVQSLDAPWGYGDTPLLVWTSRPLDTARDTVRAVGGAFEDVLAQARAIAGDRDVYVDGGSTVRAALDAGALDEVIVTVVPTALGAGVPLFAGLDERQDFTVQAVARYDGGLVQLRLAIRSS